MNLRDEFTAADARGRAFTLIEMLVVLGIIGILAAMTLPSFKTAGKGNVTESATRQLLDDMAYARLKAMSTRTKVYMVFAPDLGFFFGTNATALIGATNFLYTNAAANNLVGGQLTSYVLYSPRIVGDQPGQSTPHYLTDWRSLPDGAFIPASALRNPWIFHNAPPGFAGTTNPPPVTARFPLEEGNNTNYLLTLPFIGFDEQGRLFGRATNIVIPVVEGSIQHPTDSTGKTNQPVATDAVETAHVLPPAGGVVAGLEYLVAGQVGSAISYNGSNFYAGQAFIGRAPTNYAVTLGGPRLVQLYGVRLDWLTGRARAVKPELP